MTQHFPLFGALMLSASLAACGPADGADPVKRQAGGWEITRTMTRIEAPNMPAEMAAAAKAMMAEPDIGVLCVKAETAAQDTLASRMKEVTELGTLWKIKTSKLQDGKVTFAASFDEPKQGKSEMTITGSLSDVASDLTLITNGVDSNGVKGESEIRVQSRHLGACPADAMEQ